MTKRVTDNNKPFATLKNNPYRDKGMVTSRERVGVGEKEKGKVVNTVVISLQDNQ